MSPLKTILLLRLAVYAFPFEGITPGQIHAPAMRQAFVDFHSHGLLLGGVTHAAVCHEPRPVMGSPAYSRLSAKGQRLFNLICNCQPEDV